MLGAVKYISKWLIISCYLPLALAPSYAAANDIEIGLDHYLNGDYKSAMAHWRPLAETGDEVAEFYLGIMYENGRAVPQDAGQAAIWYRRAGAKIDSQTKNFLEHQLAGTLAKAQQMARACEDNNFQDC